MQGGAQFAASVKMLNMVMTDTNLGYVDRQDQSPADVLQHYQGLEKNLNASSVGYRYSLQSRGLWAVLVSLAGCRHWR